MRKILILMAVVCSAITACKKSLLVNPNTTAAQQNSSQSPAPNSVTPGLFGKWELTRIHGGIWGAYERDSASVVAMGIIYQFNSDSTYQYYVQGTLNEQGQFHYHAGTIKDGVNLYDNIEVGGIINAFSAGVHNAVIFNGTTFTTFHDYPDTQYWEFRKISD